MGCSGGKQALASPSSLHAGRQPGAKPLPACGGQGRLLDLFTGWQVLGKGAFGVVYLVKKKGTEEEYAVKTVNVAEAPVTRIQREVEMLRKLAHPCVMKLHSVYYEQFVVGMVTDVYRGGDMIAGMQLHWKTRGVIPVSAVRSLSRQMIEGIAWLHQNAVVHRDVKGDNYLMDRADISNPQCRIFLGDFGTARQLKEGQRLTSQCGTPEYWAPEIIAKNYGLKVDMWSIGVVAHMLLTARYLSRGGGAASNPQVTIPPGSPRECGELLRKLLEPKEQDRLSAEQARVHPFVAELPEGGWAAAEDQAFRLRGLRRADGGTPHALLGGLRKAVTSSSLPR